MGCSKFQWSNEGDEKICDDDDDDISKIESCQSRRTTTESEISKEPLLSTSGYRNVGGQLGDSRDLRAMNEDTFWQLDLAMENSPATSPVKG